MNKPKLSPELETQLMLHSLGHSLRHVLNLLEYEVKHPSQGQVEVAVEILRAAVKKWEDYDITRSDN